MKANSKLYFCLYSDKTNINIRFCVVIGGGVVYVLGVICCWWKPLNMDELQTHFSFIYS
jgi:hypothetical protein